MPHVSSVNLSFLNANKTGSATALIKLADHANGPLRLEKKVENGVTVTYLGVRSWSTYFFEKLIATPGQVAKAKVKTQAAIEQHVRSFLNNGGLTLGGRTAEGLTASLQSKVVGKSVTPQPIANAATEQKGKASTRPAYRESPEFVQTRGKIFHGATVVPSGLSVAVISPLKVIANVRLVTEASYGTHPASDSRKGLTVSQGDFAIDKRNGIKDYKEQYFARLKAVAGLIETSVVLEVQRDSGDTCSEDNQEGAREAAAMFTRHQELLGKHVSVMLAVPALPSVTKPESSTVVEVDTGAKGKPSNILVVDSSSEYLSENDE